MRMEEGERRDWRGRRRRLAQAFANGMCSARRTSVALRAQTSMASVGAPMISRTPD